MPLSDDAAHVLFMMIIIPSGLPESFADRISAHYDESVERDYASPTVFLSAGMIITFLIAVTVPGALWLLILSGAIGVTVGFIAGRWRREFVAVRERNEARRLRIEAARAESRRYQTSPSASNRKTS